MSVSQSNQGVKSKPAKPPTSSFSALDSPIRHGNAQSEGVPSGLTAVLTTRIRGGSIQSEAPPLGVMPTSSFLALDSPIRYGNAQLAVDPTAVAPTSSFLALDSPIRYGNASPLRLIGAHKSAESLPDRGMHSSPPLSFGSRDPSGSSSSDSMPEDQTEPVAPALYQAATLDEHMGKHLARFEGRAYPLPSICRDIRCNSSGSLYVGDSLQHDPNSLV